jgi:hypothetical protein
MGLFDAIFDPGKGYRAAKGDIKKGYNEAQNYLKPYNQAGMDQIGRLTGAQDKLMDPAALQNEWAKGYEMSPYAQQLQQQAMNSGMEGAGSMGLLGSSSALNTLQQGSSNIMQKDRSNYMNDLMQKYMTGIGIGTNMFNTGASAGGQLGQNAMNQGQNMAGLSFGEQNAPMNQFMNIMKLIQGFTNPNTKQ